jgi:hypothetical protein
MTTDWREELRVLDSVAPTRDLWADALARAGSPHRTSPSSRRRLMVAMAIVGLLAAAATGFGISVLVQGSGGRPRSGPQGVSPFITTLGVDPFGEGETSKLVTLQQFVADKAADGYDVPLPNSPLANSTNVGSVWESSTGGAVVWYPSSGIEVTYGGTGVDYTGVPTDEIQTINGIRAIVRPPGKSDSYSSDLAEVMLPLPSGHLVMLLSKGPVSELVSVAKTMQMDNSP